MSIKDLFNSTGSPKIQKSVTSDELVQNVESSDFVEAKKTQFEQFVPPIDFSTASNFAKFGSAELYYEKAFERIHNYYPYDGTLAEKIEFNNSSSYLDKYVFDNLYPRTNGYVNFNASAYISVFGGPHTASSGMENKPLDSTFDYSMKYDEEKKRTSAFEYRGEDGITIEFWLKKSSAITTNETIFEAKNNDGGAITLYFSSGSTNHLMLRMSSSDGNLDELLLSNPIPDSEWHHYSISVLSSSGININTYRDAQLVGTNNPTPQNIPSILPTTSGMNATIGSGSVEMSPSGTALSASMDEFRFYKKAKTHEEIFNTWFIPVGGGTNKHDSNVDLGCYFKFNEGITGNSNLDKLVLDYSGRINNGTVTNYTSAFRSTGSAITEKLGEPEWMDPIIYSSHPDVVAMKAEMVESGSMADRENSSMLINYFPAWMQEEDEQSGKQLKYLAQVMGSYFDTLWHQISFVNKIHDHHYISGYNKPLPFAKKLLYNAGFVMPDLFVDASVIESFLQKDDNEVFEKEINEVRNTIYHNLYNNLNVIYKSKGTEKSFRNFFNSLGIGQDVVKLRMYADDSTFVLRNNFENKSYERKYLNFNTEENFEATIYQTSSANNTNIHIPGDTTYSGSYTIETEIILPKKQKKNEAQYNPYPYLTSSVFGFHSGSSAYAFGSPDTDLSVYVVHSVLENSLDPDDQQQIKFVLTGSDFNLETQTFSYQYENNKWNLAVRVRHENYPYANLSGNIPDNYIIEFYGVEADSNNKYNSFLLSSSLSDNSYFTSDKIFYAGAHRQDFTGTTLYSTDIKLGYLRYWHSYLSNDAIDQHAFDSETFGANEPFENDLVNTYSIEIPREKTLAFHWAFNDLTGSDSNGELLVSDLSSGSLNSNYEPLSDIIERYIAAKGEGFSPSSMNALDKIYLNVARKRLPDDLLSSDLTVIKTEETQNFFVDDDVSDNFYSFEKSMYGSISDEMMNMFSTALDLNNLIGQPNQRYHHRYNVMDFLKDRFFDDVENEPDIQKFTTFYKWIDDSISIALQQLTPASARFSEKINNIVESHVLERSKYVHQLPITTTWESTEGSIKGISEMRYDWEHGHAPLDPTNEANNCLWQKERKTKDGLREVLRNSENNYSIQSSGLLRREIDGTARISDTYAVRKFAKTYDVSLVSQHTIHGGTNFGRKKNLQLFHESIAPAGRVGDISGAPQNVITVGAGAGQGISPEKACNDFQPLKKKYFLNAQVGNQFGNDYGFEVAGDFVLPMNVMSGTVNSGFNARVHEYYKNNSYIANLHNDVVGNYNEVSIQGPFTDNHIGGLQYRHIDLNRGSDGPQTRPEGWGLVFRDHPVNGPDADGALGFLGADYESTYPSPTAQKATRYREETAKRPVNIKNIKTLSGSWKAGNYRNEIELFSVESEKQKTWLIEAYNDPNVDILPPYYESTLPKTTNYQTLIARDSLNVGNVFGVMNNNRQIDEGENQVQSIAVNSSDTTDLYRMASSTTITGYSSFTTGNKSFSFWVNLDDNTPGSNLMYFITSRTSANLECFSIYYISLYDRLYFKVIGSSQCVWQWNGISYSSLKNVWTNIVISWTGKSADAPELIINGGTPVPSPTTVIPGVDVIRQADRIYLFDDGSTPNALYELKGSLQNFGVYYNKKLSQTDAIAIYNSGVALDIPLSSSNLLDYWELGNETSFSVGDPIPSGTIFSSSYGSLNHLTSSTGLVAVAGVDTESRFNSPLSFNQDLVNVIEIPRTDLTGSERNITTRFSAPGGPEIQTIGYLDAHSQTYSVHNAIPFRNLSVLGNGSGEEGTIRVNDHLGHRRGLKALRSLHQGKFGLDSTYGVVSSTNYSTSGSYSKQHRNTSTSYIWNGSSDITASLSELQLITGSNYDNMHINSMIPRSEFQYSWIHAATYGDDKPSQYLLGYAPKDGIISSSIGWVDAIVFPSASTIGG